MVKHIGEVEQVSDKLTKQTIVVEETAGEYPQSVAVDFLNDRVDLCKDVKAWDIVEVSMNIKANAGKDDSGRYFNSLNGWRINTIAVAK